jgi:hypothetical protein
MDKGEQARERERERAREKERGRERSSEEATRGGLITRILMRVAIASH